MNVSIEQVNNVTSLGISKTFPGTPAERSRSSEKNDIAKTSLRYIVENNKIVFERYDRYGK